MKKLGAETIPFQTIFSMHKAVNIIYKYYILWADRINFVLRLFDNE